MVIVSSSRLLLLPQFYKLTHLKPSKKLRTGFSGKNEKEKKIRERETRNTNLLKILHELLGVPDQRDLSEGMVQLPGRKMAGNTKDESITFVLTGMEEYLSELHLHNLAHLSHFLLVK